MNAYRLTATTTLSEKGQVVIPKSIRDERGWTSGIRLVVEATSDGLTLRPLCETRTRIAADLLGCIGYRGPCRTIKDMEQAIAAGVRRRV